jgi:hypothetical protein
MCSRTLTCFEIIAHRLGVLNMSYVLMISNTRVNLKRGAWGRGGIAPTHYRPQH